MKTGDQRVPSPSTSVSQSAAGLLIFQRSRIGCWKSKATAAMMTQRTDVPSNTPRAVPLSRRFCSSANAAAVCCTNIICKPTEGIDMQFSTASSVPRTPYSLWGIILENGCTPNMNAPLDTVARIIQPLCRKNVLWLMPEDNGGCAAPLEMDVAIRESRAKPRARVRLPKGWHGRPARAGRRPAARKGRGPIGTVRAC